MEQETYPLKEGTRSKSKTGCKLWNPGDCNWWIQVVLGALTTTFLTLFIVYAVENGRSSTSCVQEIASWNYEYEIGRAHV
jgi:hypothetical protein